MTFYFLLTGRAPFEGMPIAQKLLAHHMKQPKPIAELRKDVPADILTIVNRMMAKNVENRYARPGEVADALAPYTQVAIAPPTEAEMPDLSPAARGQMSGGDSAASISSATIPFTPARAPVSTPASSKTRPSAAPTPAPTVTSAKAEVAPWERLTSDTDDATAKSDTAPIETTGSSKTKQKAKPRSKIGAVIAVLVLIFVIMPLVATGIVVVISALFPARPDPLSKTGPTKLIVSRDPNRKNVYSTIQQALLNAESDSIIELSDDTYTENVTVESSPSQRANITLQAAAGKKEIVWRSSKTDPNRPILRISKAADFKLKGNGIILDGTLDEKKKKSVNDLVMISSESPGLIIEDLQFKHFARSAIFVVNAAGTLERPIQLTRLMSFTDNNEKPIAAIFFDANPKMTPTPNDHIVIEDSNFHGILPKKAIQADPKKKDILGDNVRWPGR